MRGWQGIIWQWHWAVAAGHPALKGPLVCGGTLVGNRTPKLGCRQGEDKPWLVPRLDDSRDLLRAGSWECLLRVPGSQGKGHPHRERTQRHWWHPQEVTTAVRLFPWAHPPARCSLPFEMVVSVQKRGKWVCFRPFAECTYPEVYLCSFYPC